jgi:ribosome-binding protein aMBF1 (putative translation factor)
MSHQDWNTVTFKKKVVPAVDRKQNVPNLNIVTQPTVLEPPKKLGFLISQGRQLNNKTRQRLAIELSISVNVLTMWETNRAIPTNYEIACIEKTLGVKLPRCKKGASLDQN